MSSATLSSGGSISGWATDPDWTSSDFTVGRTTDQARVRSYSLGFLSDSAKTGAITSTISFGDLSAYTTVGSGAPPTGTVGLWVYVDTATDISAISLRIGSSSGNYTQVSGVARYSGTFVAIAGWNYFVFRLKNGATTGIPNWTAVAYVRISITTTDAIIGYIDYLTIGTGDIIGLNGIGDRRIYYSDYINV